MPVQSRQPEWSHTVPNCNVAAAGDNSAVAARCCNSGAADILVDNPVADSLGWEEEDNCCNSWSWSRTAVERQWRPYTRMWAPTGATVEA